MKSINVVDKIIGSNQPVFIVAEMSCSHDGSMDIAKKIIDAAADAKADAINFQMTHMESYMVPQYNAGGVSEGKDTSDIYAYLEKLLWFWEKEWTELFEYARQKPLLISVTCNDIASAELAIKLNADIYQIHSSSLSEEDLVKVVARSKKPVTLKIGGTYLGELEKTITWIKEEGNEEIILLHGYQNYPTKWEDVNLNYIPTLQNLFSLQVGFCDHTDGDSELALFVPLLSLPIGATFLEKHITHDRAQKCEDFESALNPDEFKKFVSYVREAEKTFGDSAARIFSEDELEYRNISKKRSVASEHIKAGTLLGPENISFKRADNGMLPDEAKYLVGRKAKHDIEKNTSFSWSDLE